MSALSSIPATNCSNCHKLRAELQQLQQQICSRSNKNESPQPAPLILYQLQKGIKPPATEPPLQRQPASSPTRSPIVKAKPKSSPTPSPSSSTTPKPEKPILLRKQAEPSSVSTTTTPVGSQTIVDDLTRFALSQPSCNRCICCDLSHRSQVDLISARDHARALYEQCAEQKRKLEADVATWQLKLKTMREEIVALRSQESARNSQGNSDSKNSLSSAEKEELLLLRKQRDADARLIQRLQMQLQILSTPSTSSKSSSTALSSVSSSPPGANPNSEDWKRHQMEIRLGAEQALSRLQQLFPDQNIGK